MPASAYIQDLFEYMDVFQPSIWPVSAGLALPPEEGTIDAIVDKRRFKRAKGGNTVKQTFKKVVSASVGLPLIMSSLTLPVMAETQTASTAPETAQNAQDGTSMSGMFTDVATDSP